MKDAESQDQRGDRYSSQASLAAMGRQFMGMGVWNEVSKRVHLRQKVLVHRPQDKLLDCLIGMLAGGWGIVEVNW